MAEKAKIRLMMDEVASMGACRPTEVSKSPVNSNITANVSPDKETCKGCLFGRRCNKSKAPPVSMVIIRS